MRIKVLILYLILSVIWGTTWLVLKISLTGTPPILGVALRFLISASVLWAVLLQKREKPKFTPTAIKLYLGFGIFNFAMSYSLTYWCTQFIFSGLSSIIWSTLPIFIVILAHFILPNEKITVNKLVGTIIGLLGTFFIFWQGGKIEQENMAIGIAAVLFAVLIAAWPNVYLKRHHEKIDPLHLNVVSQTLAFLILLPTSFILENPQNMVWSLQNIFALLYLAIFGTVITWSIYFWLFSHLSVSRISTVALLPPVIAVILGWLFLNETLTLQMFFGAILVFIGVYMVNSQQVSVNK